MKGAVWGVAGRPCPLDEMGWWQECEWRGTQGGGKGEREGPSDLSDGYVSASIEAEDQSQGHATVVKTPCS